MSLEQSPQSHNPYANEADRDVAWQIDRQVESTPLPGAGQSHYSNEYRRQLALAAAERSNVARVAGELGMTSDEWRIKRAELGRSPEARDVR
jgi:transposase-like protein